MPTPHNRAEVGQIGEYVIMPGDPLRAKYIAEQYLEQVTMVNDVRNMYGYTGLYRGERISVISSGMGMPSMGIYAYELYREYGVKQIVRVGSAGSYCPECKVLDTLLVTGSYTESSFAHTMDGRDCDFETPDPALTGKLEETAKALGKEVHQGTVHCTDVFYRQGDPDYYKKLHSEKGCLAVEMESFALFHVAKVCGGKAACLLTISDSFVSGELIDAKARETGFRDMMEIALAGALG